MLLVDTIWSGPGWGTADSASPAGAPPLGTRRAWSRYRSLTPHQTRSRENLRGHARGSAITSNSLAGAIGRCHASSDDMESSLVAKSVEV